MPIDGVGASGGLNTLSVPQASGMDQLKALLAAGNMDAAISLLQTERIKGLDETLGLSMKRLQTRNEAIRVENGNLAEAQQRLDGRATPAQATKLAELEGKLVQAEQKLAAARNSGGNIFQRLFVMSSASREVAAARGQVNAMKSQIENSKEANKASAQADVTTIKGRIDALNADNQLEMIGTQDLISKRQQAHEMMTNIIGKLAKTTDSIMGNFR
jgi:hypothetical protein